MNRRPTKSTLTHTLIPYTTIFRSFADHGADDRDLQLRHLQQVARDRFGLAAFLGADARVRAGGVDERQQRQFEALGHLHQPQRLAVALRARHAEVAAHLGLGVAALLVADDHHAAAVDAAAAGDDGGDVGIAIGRAHDWTTVTYAPHGCRLRLETQHKTDT